MAIEIKIPGLKVSTGLGDVIKKATTAVGIEPCEGCQKRADKLNKLMGFKGHEAPKQTPAAQAPIDLPIAQVKAALESSGEKLREIHQDLQGRVTLADRRGNWYQWRNGQLALDVSRRA